MKRINRKKIVSWNVEEHTGGRKGVGKGSRTGKYLTESDVITAMCEAKVAGNGVTCIARNVDSEGKVCKLMLGKAFSEI